MPLCAVRPRNFMKVPLSALPPMGGGGSVHGVDQGPVAVRDLWEHKDLAPLPQGTANITVTVAGLDSAFMILAPGK